ncbi:MAG: peptide deformylase [Burkholderiaceae bacterium]|nr:peptide deformylase [Burkholderiaceae bacterium]
MAKLTILRYPDPRLHTVAQPVAAVDERVRRLVDDMLETMYANDGVGLAATQVVVGEEGCLSVPTVYDRVQRHARVTVRALGRDGESFELDAEGLTAVCVQHEMDHLMGKVFVEYLSPLKRDRIRSKLLKKAREGQFA